MKISLRWRHNELDGVSDHQPHDCLLNRLFGCRSKKTSKLRVTGLCAGNSPGTGEFSAQMASNAENVSIWWRHHVIGCTCNCPCISVKTVCLVIPIFYFHCTWLLRNTTSLQWRHDERDGISNHQRLSSLLNRLSRYRSKIISKLRVTGLCEGNSPVTGEFPAQKASNAENVHIWWRHHVHCLIVFKFNEIFPIWQICAEHR